MNETASAQSSFVGPATRPLPVCGLRLYRGPAVRRRRTGAGRGGSDTLRGGKDDLWDYYEALALTSGPR